MIENNVIQSPLSQSRDGTLLELKTGLRPVLISRLNYDYENNQRVGKGQQTERLYPLSPRAKERTSRGLKDRLQKGFTISNNTRCCGLLEERPRCSLKDSSKGKRIYAQNTERNGAQYQGYSTRNRRANTTTIRRAKRNNKSTVKGIKSETIRGYVSRAKEGQKTKLNLSYLVAYLKGFIVLLNQNLNIQLNTLFRALKIEILGIKLLSSSALLKTNNPNISGSISALKMCYFNRLNLLVTQFSKRPTTTPQKRPV